jgi:hypothetical protein
MRKPNIIATKALLFALLLSHASAQEFIGLETSGTKICNTQNGDNSGKCDTSVSAL